MLKYVEEKPDLDMLKKWFVKDENAVPASHILQRITDVLPNYNNNQATKKQRTKASGEWWKSFNRMQVVLREAARKAFPDDEELILNYFVSRKYRVVVNIFYFSSVFLYSFIV